MNERGQKGGVRENKGSRNERKNRLEDLCIIKSNKI